MSFNIKDRVVLKSNEKVKGTIVKIQRKGSYVKSCGILWDNEWPTNDSTSNKYASGRVFYYKVDDLKVIDTWRV